MPLNTLFSLTPNNPWAYSYDSANPNAPYAMGHLASYGGHSAGYSPYRLPDQSTNNEIIVGYNPATPGDGTINSLADDFYARSTITVNFYGDNVATDNQYLLLAQLNGRIEATAQFFIGTELVREEAISGEEQVAVLIDVPGDAVPVTFYIRLASTSPYASMGFKGLDCYLL